MVDWRDGTFDRKREWRRRVLLAEELDHELSDEDVLWIDRPDPALGKEFGL